MRAVEAREFPQLYQGPGIRAQTSAAMQPENPRTRYVGLGVRLPELWTNDE
jgi:hypothetical protein